VLRLAQDIHTQRRNNMSEVKSKTGYEIRTEILGMAQGLLTEKHRNRFQVWEQTAERDKETGRVLDTNAPAFPDETDIIALAEKMYEFVNKK